MITTFRTRIATLAAAAALGLAACGSGSVPTGPSASAAPPATAALPATATPVDPTPVVNPTPVDPTPVGGSEQPGVVISAANIAFMPRDVTVPANVPLTLVLDNRDAGIPHNIAVSDANGNVIVQSEIVSGPGRIQVALPALAPGGYSFVCVVHPNMMGTITAE